MAGTRYAQDDRHGKRSRGAEERMIGVRGIWGDVDAKR
jgi:hypothetical protein